MFASKIRLKYWLRYLKWQFKCQKWLKSIENDQFDWLFSMDFDDFYYIQTISSKIETVLKILIKIGLLSIEFVAMM